MAASGALASLPFEVLVTKPPSGNHDDPAALRATSWLADTYALVQIPSLQSLDFICRFSGGAGQSANGLGANGFVGFGDPVQSDPLTPAHSAAAQASANKHVFGPKHNRDGGGIADFTALRTLPSLPGTALELDNMRSALGAPLTAIRLREQDTETAVHNADLSQVRVLAFATHGLLAGAMGDDSEPGLVFNPPDLPGEADYGLLTASEITTLTLNADWVILSACNTAAGDRSGEGLSGLARAFFYAGARSLLASHWPVRDDVTAELTVAAIKVHQAGMSRADALQAAKRQIRNDPTDPTRADPSAWAPFSLVREGR